MRTTAARAALAAVVSLSAGALVAGSAQAPAPPVAVEALQVGQCTLCHAPPAALVEQLPEAGRTDSCAGCHRWIREVAADPERRAKAVEIFPLWERYERSVASYLQVPDLGAAMARLEGDWVAGYLVDPHDVRPNLPEGMPRFNLSAEQRAAIGALFEAHQASVPPTPKARAGNMALGERLFVERGCAACHNAGARFVGAALPLAPDLAHAKRRMDRDHLAAWIRDPEGVHPNATMPAQGLSEEEVLALRDFLILADLQAPAPPPVGPAPTAVRRPVGWAEVEERVFGRICAHCHMKPELNDGRAGPGNAGGFGWAPTGIELQTYEGVVAVAESIPDALLRRREEARRDTVGPGQAPAALERPALPGMPLGLPALPDEDIALVLGWIEQGMPR